MIKNTERMWEELAQYKIKKISFIKIQEGLLHTRILSKDDFTFEYQTGLLGYTRVMMLYEEMIKYYPIDELKLELLGQSAFILLITTLESYLERIFHELCRSYKVKDVDEQTFRRYLNKVNVRLKYNYLELEEIRLSNFIPERMNFQDKKICKEAFLLFNLRIAEIDRALWNRIYGEEEGYMKIRHGIIHFGPDFALYKTNRITITYFEEFLINIANFLNQVDNEILKEHKNLFI